MPTIDIRKIVKLGDSYVVSLPSGYVRWLQEEGIEELKLTVNGEEMLVEPVKKS